MSAVSRKFGSRRAACAARRVFTIIGFAGAGLLSRPAQGEAPVYSDTLPLSQVKAGMTGYGLTTFKGTTISRFDVTVIGILRKVNNGHDLIMIRMKGGPITERGANLIQGMSGSPIYINGKCIGAFSQGETWPKEPVGMVTPIEDMLEAWDPNIPQTPPYFQPAEKQPAPSAPATPAPANPSPTDGGKGTGNREQKTGGRKVSDASVRPSSIAAWKPDNSTRVVRLPQPIRIGGRDVSRLVLNARPDTPIPHGADVAVMRRATTYAVVGGVGERERAWFQKELDKRGYAFTLAQSPTMGAGRANIPATPLRPGSCFGTFLSSGDVEFGAFGTVTYRRDNRILGFGHPFFGFGALNAAATSASVIDVFSGIQVSHLVAEAGPVVGTITQDRNFSVAVELGRKPTQIPFDVTVNDETTHRSKTFHSLMFQHPELTAALMGLIGKAAVSQIHNTPGDVMARVTTTVEAGEVGKITRKNLLFDADDISGPAIQDLTEITNIVSGNPFYPLPIKRASMTVDLFRGHNTATVERIFLKQGRYEPGDTLDVGVALKPYRRDSIFKNLSIKIPSDTPTGRYALVVRGGTASVMRIGPFVISGGAADPSTPPVNVRQMIARLNTHEANTDMVARLVLNTGAPALEGEKLSQLPPNLAVLMRSDRNSGVRIERDEIRAISPTDYIVSGSQQLYVTVVRKNTQEPTGSASFGGGASSLPTSSSIPTPSGGASAAAGGGLQDDDEKEGGASGFLPLSVTTQHWLSVLNASGLNVPAPNNSEVNAFGAISPAANASEPDALSRAGSEQGANDSKPMAAQAQNPPVSPLPVNPLPAVPVAPAAPAKTPKAGKGAKVKGGKNAAAPTVPLDSTASVATSAPDAKATTPSDTEPVKIVGRQLQVWRQSGQSGFASGKFVGTSVTATGELRLAPRLRRLATTNETYIWAIVSDAQGNLYAGTGTGGKILKVDAAGKVTTFAQLPVVSVQSLLMAHDGSLWAGSSVRGNLYHVKTDGTFALVATLPEKYILALCEDSQGNVYVGPGGGGSVYKIPAGYAPKDATRTDALAPWIKTGGDYVTCMTLDKQDNLYVGTGNEGIVYKITPGGKSSVLYDAKENSITALALDGRGGLYAGTGPKGLLYHIGTDGTATVVYDRATSFYTGLKMAGDGTLYATTVNTAYHIFPQTPATSGDARPVVQPLDNPRDVDFLTLALSNGGVVIGTGNIGELYTSQPERVTITGTLGGVDGRPIPETSLTIPIGVPASGTFVSVIHDSKLVSRWGTLRWNASLPSGARLHVETRTGSVAEPDATWSDWQSVTPVSSGEGRIISSPARFIQYRLTLEGNFIEGATFLTMGGGTTKQSLPQITPAVREISLSYMPRNQAPRVAFTSPVGGERWAKSQTIRWSGSDPDGDTLSYDLFYSTDGVTWKPLPTTATGTPTSPTTTATTPTTSAGLTATNSVAETQARLDAQANTPEPIRRMILESAQRRKEAGSLSDGASAGNTSTLRDTSKTWDTRGLPDGTYWLKVVTSDVASNPTEPQSASAISEPFVVANALPTLTLSGSPSISADRRVTLGGSASQALITITAVQYRVDGGEWLAAAPTDGLFDSAQERFGLVTASLTPGKHIIEVAAFNAANAKTVQRVEVTVP